MKRILFVLLIQSLISCGEKVNSTEAATGQEKSLSGLESAEKIEKVPASEHSMDWAGTYSGVLPCEICEGVEVVLTLHKDKTFYQRVRHLNSSDEKDETNEGEFSWSEKIDKIKLEGVQGYSEYKVTDLFLLPIWDGVELKPVPGNNFQLLKE